MLLVINSSTNMILYIFLNESFRRHFMTMVRHITEKVGCANCLAKVSYTHY